MARTSVEQHRHDVAELLAGLTGPRPAQDVPIARALDRVLAEDVHAPVDLPLFRNSQMDGFAVHAVDVARAVPGAPVRLPVVAEVPAGPGEPGTLPHGAAARIMTGAPVPEGADAVVPVEDTDAGTFGRGGTARATVEVAVARRSGEFVRDAGSDVRAGDLLLRAGTLLGPSQLAAAAACGIAELPVVARPRVAVVSTGSELVEPGGRPGPGEVYDANLVALAAAVRRAGGEVTFTTRVGDDVGQLGPALETAAGAADLVLTSGGVSQGAYEVVKDVLAGDGSTVEFRSVAMQPGGPQGLGTVHGTPILTFPGNPVSAQVSFVVFVRDVLRRAGGLPPLGDRLERRVLAGAPGTTVLSPAGRRQMLRGTRAAEGTVDVVGGAGSHLVASMAGAEVLIDVPAEVTILTAGDEVEVWEL